MRSPGSTPRADLGIALGTLPQLHRARLVTAALGDEHRGLTLHQHHRLLGDPQGLRRTPGRDRDRGEHLGLEPAVRVGNLDPRLEGARRLVHEVAHVGEPPCKAFPRIGRDRDARPKSGLGLGKILFIQVRLNPEHREVGDREQRLIRSGQLAQHGVLLDDGAGKRRLEREHRARSGIRVNAQHAQLFRGYVQRRARLLALGPHPEILLFRNDVLPVELGRPIEVGLGERGLGLGLLEIQIRLAQLHAVETSERLPFIDPIAEARFDPHDAARHTGRDVREPVLVGLDGAGQH